MTEQMTIKNSYTEDGMFGPTEENRTGADIPASFAKFEQMLTDALQAQYPNAEIEISNGIQDKTEAYPDFEDELPWIQEIVNQVWQSWEWMVSA